MREIVLDTETTGLDPTTGDKIVEIGAVELINHLPSKNNYHQYINPQRSMPAEALAVHGLSDAFLADKPIFADIADAFLSFIGDSPLIIHNASFDMKFINHELAQIGRPILPAGRATDTLMIARNKFPRAPASLDALCRRFGIDNSAREKHGALLDSEILAEVYLELIGGRQPDFALSEIIDKPKPGLEASSLSTSTNRQRTKSLAPRITAQEASLHAAFIEKLGDAAIWKKRS